MKPRETIDGFDRFLQARGLELDAIVIGGVALAFLGVVSRQTRDCEVLDPVIPRNIAEAAAEFAADVRAAGEALHDDWFNNPRRWPTLSRRAGGAGPSVSFPATR